MAIVADGHDCCLPDSKMLEKNAMNYECAREDCKNFHRGKMQNRGPYQEDKSQQDNIIKKTIVRIEQYQGKSEKHDFWIIVSLLMILQC